MNNGYQTSSSHPLPDDLMELPPFNFIPGYQTSSSHPLPDDLMELPPFNFIPGYQTPSSHPSPDDLMELPPFNFIHWSRWDTKTLFWIEKCFVSLQWLVYVILKDYRV